MIRGANFGWKDVRCSNWDGKSEKWDGRFRCWV